MAVTSRRAVVFGLVLAISIAAAGALAGGGPRTFNEDHRGRTVRVKRGELFDVELWSPVSSRYKYSWSDPVLDGASVEALGKDVRSPPAIRGRRANGGSYRHIFHFRSRAKGVTKLTIASTGDEHAPMDFRLVVDVR